MSKFVFLLCAFLMAGAVYAEEEGKIMQMKNALVEKIDGGIQTLKKQLAEYGAPLKSMVNGLEGQSKQLRKKIFSDIEMIKKAAQPEIDELLKKATDSDVEECAVMGKSLEKIARATAADSEQCINDLINGAFNDVDEILKSGTETVNDLVQAEEDAESCVKNNGWGAPACIAGVATTTTALTVIRVPDIVVNLGSLYLRFKNFLPNLTKCAVSNGTQKVKGSARQVIENVAKCVKAKGTKGSSGSWFKWGR